jgi:hypothetical protein
VGSTECILAASQVVQVRVSNRTLLLSGRPDNYRDWQRKTSAENCYRIKIGLIFLLLFLSRKKVNKAPFFQKKRWKGNLPHVSENRKAWYFIVELPLQ